MAKYWVSGALAFELGFGSASEAGELLGATLTSGRSLWLTGIILPIVTSAATGPQYVNLYDAASGTIYAAGAAGAATYMKASFICPSATESTGGYPTTQVVEIPMPGLRFGTGCTIMTVGTEVIYTGDIGGMGYEV